MSIRELARRIDPARPDVARRNLARWIGGYNQPSRLSRIAVAEAFGLPREELLEDDEESDPVTDLYRALDRFMDHKIEARL